MPLPSTRAAPGALKSAAKALCDSTYPRTVSVHVRVPVLVRFAFLVTGQRLLSSWRRWVNVEFMVAGAVFFLPKRLEGIAVASTVRQPERPPPQPPPLHLFFLPPHPFSLSPSSAPPAARDQGTC